MEECSDERRSGSKLQVIESPLLSSEGLLSRNSELTCCLLSLQRDHQGHQIFDCPFFPLRILFLILFIVRKTKGSV